MYDMQIIILRRLFVVYYVITESILLTTKNVLRDQFGRNPLTFCL